MISWKGVVLQTKVKPQTKGTVLLVCWKCTDILLFVSKHAKGESTEKVEKRGFRAVGNGYKPPQNLYFIHYFYSFSVLSPKACPYVMMQF